MKIRANELQSLYENYQKTLSQYHTLKQQITLINFKSPTTYENETHIETSISSDLIQKLNEAFRHIPSNQCLSKVDGKGRPNFEV